MPSWVSPFWSGLKGRPIRSAASIIFSSSGTLWRGVSVTRSRPSRPRNWSEPPCVALHALEDRQHVLVAPAAVAELGPVVVVLRLAADIDHAVDRARPAQHLAARNFYAPPARALVRLRRVAPVDGRIVDHLGDADRHARPEEVRALGPRLEQQHPVGAAFRQPAGDDRPGRTGPDDDVVIGRIARHGVRVPPLGPRKPAPGRDGKGTARDRPRPAPPGDEARWAGLPAMRCIKGTVLGLKASRDCRWVLIVV